MAIVFDMGNVLISTSFKVVFRNLGLQTEEFEKDDAYYDFTRGEITAFGYYRHFISQYKLDLDYQTFRNAWNSFFLEANDNLVNLIDELGQSNKLFVLSNSNIIHAIYAQRKFSKIFSKFDCIIYSFELGLRKPENKIFEFLIQIVDEKPEDIIFIDDKLENIDAANKTKIRGVLYTGMSSLKSSLVKAANGNN